MRSATSAACRNRESVDARDPDSTARSPAESIAVDGVAALGVRVPDPRGKGGTRGNQRRSSVTLSGVGTPEMLRRRPSAIRIVSSLPCSRSTCRRSESTSGFLLAHANARGADVSRVCPTCRTCPNWAMMPPSPISAMSSTATATDAPIRNPRSETEMLRGLSVSCGINITVQRRIYTPPGSRSGLTPGQTPTMRGRGAHPRAPRSRMELPPSVIRSKCRDHNCPDRPDYCAGPSFGKSGAGLTTVHPAASNAIRLAYRCVDRLSGAPSAFQSSSVFVGMKG